MKRNSSQAERAETGGTSKPLDSPAHVQRVSFLTPRLDEPASLAPPNHVGLPRPEHAVNNRAFQGIPSLAVAPGGRFWATWYAGVTPAEDENNYVVLSTSGDGGKTWKEILTVDPDEDGPAQCLRPRTLGLAGRTRVLLLGTNG